MKQYHKHNILNLSSLLYIDSIILYSCVLALSNSTFKVIDDILAHFENINILKLRILPTM